MFQAQCLIILAIVTSIRCKMEGYIVGGAMADIEQFPHCAFLSMTCINNMKSWTCGSSILNQDILLTAAHCLAGCQQLLKISISAGSVLKNRGHIKTLAERYLVHKLYRPQSTDHDIGLVKIKDRIKFNTKSSRVAVMRNPPMIKHAQLAGWGLIDERINTRTRYLMHLQQTVWKKSDCETVLGETFPGRICASCNKDQFAAPGDSGSALVVNDYIQIGIVSFKKPQTSRYLIVYTDVSYYYDWIHKNAKRLHCT